MLIKTSSSMQYRKWAAQFGSYTPSTDVPNLSNWWRADTATIGTGVSSLNDKKGSVNLTQATGSKQPVQTAANALYNNRSTILFDGIDDALIAASPGVGTLNDITIYMVIGGLATPASNSYLLTFGLVTAAKTVSVRMLTTSTLLCAYNNPANTQSDWRMSVGVATNSDAASNRPCILSWSGSLGAAGASIWATGGYARMGKLGLVTGTSATGSTLDPQAIGLGATPAGTSLYSSFNFCEAMVCSSAHTAEQMLAVNMYLAGYYDVLS